METHEMLKSLLTLDVKRSLLFDHGNSFHFPKNFQKHNF